MNLWEKCEKCLHDKCWAKKQLKPKDPTPVKPETPKKEEK